MALERKHREVTGEYPVGYLHCFLLVCVFLLAGCRTETVTTPTSKIVKDASPVDPLFQEVTAQAGIQFVHENGAKAGKLQFVEATPAGCAFVDYDDDGWPDVLFIQSGSITSPGPLCALYHNNKDGTFTDVTAGSGMETAVAYGHGVAVGDYDNDGFDDLYMTAYGRNYLFHNDQGTGKFTDVTQKMGLDRKHSTGFSTSAAFGDYDNDGKLDLYVCYYCPWTLQTDKQCRDARGNREYCSPEVYPPDTHVLYHNDGNRFFDVSASSGINKVQGRGLAVAFVDYDEDGKQDIFVANDLSGNMLWHNEGKGKFVEKGLEVGCRYGSGGTLMAGMGVAVADYDHSGHESLFVTNFESMPNMLFQNRGDGLLDDVTTFSRVGIVHMPYLSFGCEFLDYDDDSWPDLLIANGHVHLNGKGLNALRQRKQLLHNEGTGQFQEISDPGQLGEMNTPTIARGLAVGDYDNDGRQDALFSNQNGPPQLFRNLYPGPNHWVSFKAIGTQSNRDGLHARFILTAGGSQRVAVVRSGSSYLSVSDQRVHFGLGAVTKVEKVEIQWPSGKRDVLTDIEADQGYVVTEGKGVTGQLPKPVR